MNARLIPTAALLLTVLGTTHTFACSIPVFRYALQFWEPDPYEAFVFHRGALSSDAENQANKLESALQGDAAPNLVVRRVDLTGPLDDNARAVWEKEKKRGNSENDPSLPRVVVRYPSSYGLNDVVDGAPLKSFAVDAWLDSPARREISERLAKGETAVWIFLESGNREKDDAAAQIVAESLKTLESSLSLPTPASEDDVLRDLGLQVASEVRIAFSSLRIAMNDPREAPLVKLLIGSEEDLVDLAENPMLFAVFGRGRMLPALVGGGITADNIREMGSFLCGPCSCQVKTENPGVDLLFQVDWKTLLIRANDAVAKEVAANGSETNSTTGSDSEPNLIATAVPTLTKIDGPQSQGTNSASLSARVAALDRAQANGSPTAAVERPRPVFQSVLLLAALGLAVLLVGTVILTKKSQ